MQKGHMRFEPNINCVLELRGGREVRTPIAEVKNLNSFRAVAGAIEFEVAAQPGRWRADGVELGAGTKSTLGWDDERRATVLQRSKEDAHDYRYFPDPDLLPVRLTGAWVEERRAELPELPHARSARYRREFGLDAKAAASLAEDREDAELFDAAVASAMAGAGHAGEGGLAREAAGKHAANVVLQGARALANERGLPTAAALGVSAQQIAGVAALRADDLIDSASVGAVIGALAEAPGETARAAAEKLGVVKVKDTAQLEAWVDAVLADPANAGAVADLKAGKGAAVGRLIGGVMKESGGRADAKDARAMIAEKLGLG
jgi:aspartyl-tRNA(Asn)/glutamyl-tRNA(Gln) amidotransferase subunit B